MLGEDRVLVAVNVGTRPSFISIATATSRRYRRTSLASATL